MKAGMELRREVLRICWVVGLNGAETCKHLAIMGLYPSTPGLLENLFRAWDRAASTVELNLENRA